MIQFIPIICGLKIAYYTKLNVVSINPIIKAHILCSISMTLILIYSSYWVHTASSFQFLILCPNMFTILLWIANKSHWRGKSMYKQWKLAHSYVWDVSSNEIKWIRQMFVLF